MEIAREYLPAEVEKKWLARWEEADLFRADPEGGRDPFCMVIPPPNVTGNLHIGHVLVYTLHDVVARWRRMQGYDVLWLPGTDHAGIATQMVVERELAKEGKSRHDLGREKFEKRVWEWKETYGNRILESLRTLGSSCDWSRERFTLDEGLTAAVRAVFVRLYDEGLIYRDRYIVNWCPRCHTAISDLETIHEPVEGKLYTVRYPFVDGEGGLEVATTRPETMFGDTGVAVHPDDERYADLVGKEVVLPIAGRNLRIVADDFVDREFGTGAVKITPAHDPNDFAAGRRHDLPELLALDTSGRMTREAGEFAGLDRFEAREKVVERLESEKLLLDVRRHDHAVGHCQRCRTMIEPMVSTQWFVKIADLAKPAIEAVESGRTEFVPDTWLKTYYEWMRNIHDWCISRQLWWGHRIPAWYCDACGTMIVSETDPDERCETCGKPLRQEEDVLDTWFSSALWPFSTMGWPRETMDLQRYYPTTLLITGFDIIFFWVARMIMMGMKFGRDVPFRTVYIHGLVRDAKGQKMSKSKGNTIDPLEVQERYGTDAVRFTMSILAAPGNDIPLAPERMDGYRAFANKLWNACRFVLMRMGDGTERAEYRRDELSLVDRWILSEAGKLVGEVSRALEQFRFDRASDALYHFVWHQFCDWYIEFVKPDLTADGERGGSRRAAVSRSVLLEVLDDLLHMLHPFMPFITEELWEKLPGGDGCLAAGRWPDSDSGRIDDEAVRQVEALKNLVVRIRNLRAENRIDPGKRINVLLRSDDATSVSLVRDQADRIATLVRADSMEVVERFEEDMVAARGVADGFEVAIPLEGLLDLEAERRRIAKEIGKMERDLLSSRRKLANPSFLERAPHEVVEKERASFESLAQKKQQLEDTMRNLGGAGKP